MDAMVWRVESGAQGIRVHLAIVARQVDQLGAAGEELGRAAFVTFDVGVGMAEDRAVGRCHHRQAERVGRRAGGDQEDVGVTFEDLGDAP